METLTIPVDNFTIDLYEQIKQKFKGFTLRIDFIKSAKQNKTIDGWYLLSAEEQEDIEAGLRDYENGDYSDAKEFLKQLRHERQ